MPDTPDLSDPSRNNLVAGGVVRGLLSMSGPMLLSGILQNTQTVIDFYWIGGLGATYVAGVGVGGTVLSLLFPVIMGAALGTVALVSRSIGAGDKERASRIAGNSMVLSIITGIVMGLTGWAFATPLSRLLSEDEAVIAVASSYLEVSFLGCFTVFALFTANSALQGAGNAILPMIAMLFANVANIVLDPLLIYGLAGFPRMEAVGAALATVISQMIAVVIVMWKLRRPSASFHVAPKDWRIDREITWKLIKLGIPSTGQMLSRSLMSMALMWIVGTCGALAQAAYSIVMRFHMLLLLPAFAFGNATAAIVGQNLGAGKLDRAKKVAWVAAGMEMGIMAVGALLMVVFAPAIMRSFSRNESQDVVSMGVSYLRIVSPSLVFGAVAIVFGRALQGAGDTIPPMVITIISLWCFQVPMAYWMSRHFAVPTDGIWWASALASLIHGVLVTAWFQLGRWQTRRI